MEAYHSSLTVNVTRRLHHELAGSHAERKDQSPALWLQNEPDEMLFNLIYNASKFGWLKIKRKIRFFKKKNRNIKLSTTRRLPK